MKWFLSFIALSCALSAGAQRVVSLDSCRAMALRNNKQLNASRLKQKVATNVRELEGCVKRINGAALAQKTRISLALAQKLIEPFYQKTQKLVNVDLIIHCVSSYFGISRDDLMGRCRKKEISCPRKVAMYLARNHTSLSLPAIGQAFDRDHTTIMSAVQSITNDIKTDRELELNVKMIEQKLFDNR